MPAPQQPAQPNLLQQAGSGLMNYGKSVMGDINSASDDITKQIQTPIANTSGPIDPATGKPQSNMGKGALENGFAITGDLLKAVTSPLTELLSGTLGKGNDALRTAVGNMSDSLMNLPQGTSNARAKASEDGGLAEMQQLASQNPEVAKNLNTLNNIVQSALLITGTDEAGQGLDAGLDRLNNPQLDSGTLQAIASGANPTIETPETPTETEGEGQSTQDTLQSRINDAKPNYNKNMIGSHVMTPDITDESGQTIKGQITPRVANENTNFTGDRPVTTSASEHAAGTELNNIKDYPDNGTNLEKGLATEKAIGEEAENMRSQVAAEDKSDPLDTKAERAKVTDYVTSHLDQDEQAKFEEGKGTKTAMGKYTAQVNEAVANYDGTREGKLDLRQQLDNIYKANRGKLAFQGDSGNVLDETHTDIRDAINKDLKGSTNNTDTQASLNKQTKLYRAQDVLYEKAKAEAPNKFGRALEKAPIVGRLGNRILLREAASGILKGAGYVAAAGAGALGYEAIKNK
jgi:hypothetical protein